VTIRQHQPPLSFIGFHVGMPLREAESFVKRSGGNWSCKTAKAPGEERCSGGFNLPALRAPIALTFEIAGTKGSVTQVDLKALQAERIAPAWVSALQGDYGAPVHTVQAGVQHSWTWLRGGQTLRVVEHQGESVHQVETTVTVAGGALPYLPPAPAKRPN
jgi:hypothetical protein